VKIGMFLAPSEQTMYTGLTLPPNTLGVMTSYLRQEGHQVRQYDLDTDLLDLYEGGGLDKEDLRFIYTKTDVLNYLDGRPDEQIDRVIRRFLDDKPIEDLDIVGISLGGSFSWMPIHLGLLIAKYIKAVYGIPVIVGGNNVYYLTLFEDTFAELWPHVTAAFRFVIVGSGHDPLTEIIEHLEADPGWVPREGEVSGLVSRHENTISYPAQAKSRVLRPDFDGLQLDYYLNYLKDPSASPDPVRAQQENLDQMFKWPSVLQQQAKQVYRQREPRGYLGKLVIPFTFNYHCAYRCAFCAESDKSAPLVIGDPHQVVDDLEYLLGTYDTEYVYFYNNYFNLSRSFVTEFCAEVKRRRLKFYWQDCARFNKLDAGLLRQMKESGCQTLWFGMESGGERMMRLIDKRLTLEQVQLGLGLCKDAGIRANLEMIVGFPHEGRADFAKTVHFIRDNRELINYFQTNRYFVVPSSTMGRRPDDFGMRIVRSLYTYDSLLATNWEWLCSDLPLSRMPNNFDIYGFDEVDGREHEEIRGEARRRLNLMHTLQRPEFDEQRQMLTLLDILSKPVKPSRGVALSTSVAST
jgi:radical SAM superfamily enzyme YgiQ (UPF0313 family)